MKYDITPEDLRRMESDLKTDRTLKYLRNLTFYKFSIGDVLIREDKYYKYGAGATEYEWKVKLAECGLPNKYVYVFENELNVGYIRRLSVNGRKFVDHPVCVTEFDPDTTRFSLDPEYADHMLLSEENAEFDAKSRYDEIKKKREQIHRKNKKQSLKFADEQAVLDWMATLKIGDQLYWGTSIKNLYKEPHFVCDIVMTEKKEPGMYGRVIEPGIHISSSPQTVTSAYSNYPYRLSVSDILAGRYFLFTSKPTFMDEIIN